MNSLWRLKRGFSLCFFFFGKRGLKLYLLIFAVKSHGVTFVVLSCTQQVHGEIYEVDGNVLSSLDELEGHPTWYKRTPCEIITTEKAAGIEAGDVISCLAYFLIDFTEEFLSKEFLSEYTLEHQLASTYTGPSSRM